MTTHYGIVISSSAESYHPGQQLKADRVCRSRMLALRLAAKWNREQWLREEAAPGHGHSRLRYRVVETIARRRGMITVI